MAVAVVAAAMAVMAVAMVVIVVVGGHYKLLGVQTPGSTGIHGILLYK